MPRGYSPHRAARYIEFVQRVRRHRPSELLPAIATAELGGIEKIMARVAYEQFSYQESDFEEFSRTQAMIVDGIPGCDLDVITPETLTELLGSPVRDSVGVAFLLTASATINAGYFDPSWLDQPNFEEILVEIPKERVDRKSTRLI